ncbi:MAG: hypothetical protein H8E36_07600 [Rhodospirillaceae bacterium]|nr:hypothetical protein [Rhodospirillaceae bacterium]MBL6931247.1 hypothetical protein [Rhodospirillales bacterium]MBL6942241.1 hypothetical protein [Rhodospirillales bacterium]
MKREKLQVAKSVELGPRDVALVWSDEGLINAYVSDQGLSEAPPQHVLLALAVMMSMDDSEIVGRMWDTFEKMMDEDIQRQSDV